MWSTVAAGGAATCGQAALDDVRGNPRPPPAIPWTRVHLVEGPVEETIPGTLPARSPSFGSTPTGMSRPATSSSTCTRGWSRVGS